MVVPDALQQAIATSVNAGQLAGASYLIWRNAEIVQAGAVGWRDIDAGLPTERNTIFRIASMTKPITCVAALMLLEEGRFALHDSITRWAPEFASLRVLRTAAGPLDDTVPAERPITFDDLLTHRSGITYGAFHSGPMRDAYAATLGREVDSDVDPDSWIRGLASLPLVAQPGSAFHYGHSTDLLGLLIARMEGASLGEVLARRLFRPLGMKDTSFIVPPEKWHRRAALYGFDDAGRLARRVVATGDSTVAERPADMLYESGGSGLWSTVDDYLAFARIFISDGVVDGARMLARSTLALMTANQLTPLQRATSNIFGIPIFATGHGYGMGVAVVTDPLHAPATLCAGGVGTVGWPGAWGGWWQADPTDVSVMIFLTHHLVEPHQWAQGIGMGVYETITRVHAAASI